MTHFNTSTPHPCGSVPGPAPGGGAAGAKGEKRPPRKAGERKSGKARLGWAGAAVFVAVFVSVRGRCLRLRPWRARSGPRRVRVGRERAGCGGKGPGGAALLGWCRSRSGWGMPAGAGAVPGAPPGWERCPEGAAGAQGDPDLCFCPSCLRSVLPGEEERDGEGARRRRGLGQTPPGSRRCRGTGERGGWRAAEVRAAKPRSPQMQLGSEKLLLCATLLFLSASPFCLDLLRRKRIQGKML